MPFVEVVINKHSKCSPSTSTMLFNIQKRTQVYPATGQHRNTVLEYQMCI